MMKIVVSECINEKKYEPLFSESSEICNSSFSARRPHYSKTEWSLCCRRNKINCLQTSNQSAHLTERSFIIASATCTIEHHTNLSVCYDHCVICCIFHKHRCCEHRKHEPQLSSVTQCDWWVHDDLAFDW